MAAMNLLTACLSGTKWIKKYQYQTASGTKKMATATRINRKRRRAGRGSYSFASNSPIGAFPNEASLNGGGASAVPKTEHNKIPQVWLDCSRCFGRGLRRRSQRRLLQRTPGRPACHQGSAHCFPVRAGLAQRLWTLRGSHL